MVTYDQISRGTAEFIRQELAPKMSTLPGLALAAFGPRVVEGNVRSICTNKWIQNSGLSSENTADVDEAYKLMKEAAVGHWPIELMGFKFSESDLDKLYDYIRRA